MCDFTHARHSARVRVDPAEAVPAGGGNSCSRWAMMSALTSMIRLNGGNSLPVATSAGVVMAARDSAARRNTSSGMEGHFARDAA